MDFWGKNKMLLFPLKIYQDYIVPWQGKVHMHTYYDICFYKYILNSNLPEDMFKFKHHLHLHNTRLWSTANRCTHMETCRIWPAHTDLHITAHCIPLSHSRRSMHSQDANSGLRNSELCFTTDAQLHFNMHHIVAL